MSGHPTGLRALTQSGEQFQACVAVGLHSDLLLEGDDRPHRVTAGAAVDVVLETVLVEPTLYFLDLCQSRRALSAGELLAERWIASDEVAEMAERQRVAAGWIVRIDRTEILSDQERRPAGDRNPELRLVAGPGKCNSVGALHAQFVPFRVKTHRPVVCKARLAGRHLHLTTPSLAAPIISALEQVARRAGEGIVGLAERRGA